MWIPPDHGAGQADEFLGMRIFQRIVPFLLCGCALWAQAPSQQLLPPEDLAAGERTYRTQCASCHGMQGEGGRGAILARPRLLHAPDDPSMFNVIANGIPDTEMPGHWFTDREIRQLVAFVRTLGRAAPQKAPGDVASGEKLYAGKGGCAACHTIGGRGGAIGPDLSDIGARRSLAYLRESLVNPEGAVPEGFLQVQLVTRNGQRMTGIRLNEDTFSIQIRDLSGDFRSFFKTELAELHKQAGKSPMPSYTKTFTQSELEDVVAYLDSRRGLP
jgi:putative heme-binding domain-containing protein